MRGNRVKEKLKAGQIATVVASHSNSPDTVDFLGPLGFDGFWIDGEHGGIAWDQIGNLTRACDLWGISSLMRIQGKEPGRITRTLDQGINGLIIPHVNIKEEAEQVVQAAKFAPVGRRGIFGGRRSYGQPDFFQQANDEILVMVMIEEMRAVEKLAEILTVDHIDIFFVAPGDLAQTMGLIGQVNHPQVQAVMEQTLRQIVDAGRVAGTLGLDETLEQYIDLGVRFFSVGSDAWLKAGAQQYLAKIESLENGG